MVGPFNRNMRSGIRSGWQQFTVNYDPLIRVRDVHEIKSFSYRDM